MSDRSDQLRLVAIRQAEQEELRLDEEQAHLDEEQARLDAKKRAIHAKKIRLSRELPDPNLCADCWFNHGVESLVKPVPSGSQRGADVWRCSKCGHEEIRKH